MKFGGTMAFNDFNWAYKVEPEPEGNMAKFLSYWKRWFDYRHWEYMGNVLTFPGCRCSHNGMARLQVPAEEVTDRHSNDYYKSQ